MKLPKEIGAVSVDDHKYAALFFDWVLPLHSYSSVPRELRFPRSLAAERGGPELLHILPPDDPDEIRLPVIRNPGKAYPDAEDWTESLIWGIKNAAHGYDPRVIESYLPQIENATNRANQAEILRCHKLLRTNSALYLCARFSHFGISLVPLFVDQHELRTQLPDGDKEALRLVLTNVPGLNTGGIDWQQVLEVRKDSDAMGKLSRFRTFIRDEYSGKSPDYVRDSLCAKINAYEEACRKHGLTMILSSLEVLLDSDSALAATAAITAGILTGQLPAAGAATVALGIGKVAFSIAKAQRGFDEYKNDHELTYLFDIRELSHRHEQSPRPYR